MSGNFSRCVIALTSFSKMMFIFIASSLSIVAVTYSNHVAAEMSCSTKCEVYYCEVTGTRPRPPAVYWPPIGPPKPERPPHGGGGMPYGNEVCGGNPVQLATGIKVQYEEDLKIEGSLLSLSRTYIQNNDMRGMYGNKWVSAFDIRLNIVENVQGVIEIYLADGTNLLAVKQGDYWFTDNQGIIYKNEQGNYVWNKTDGSQQIYDQFGRIDSIRYKNGQYWLFSHYHWVDKEGDPFSFKQSRLSKAEFSSGASFSFKYDMEGLLLAVTDQNNHEYTYSYNDHKLLTHVVMPDGTTRSYSYQDTRHPGALTQIDVNGQMYAQWHYDQQGRAISSEHAGGVDKHLFSYNNNGSTTLTNPLGKETTYYFKSVNNRRVLSHVEGHQSDYCAASYKATEYDAYGFDDKVSDWQGNITDYDYNQRGLIEKVTVGFATDDAVSVITKWHPYFHLPVEETTPTTQTTFEYNELMQLVKKTVKGINTGQARTWNYNRSYHPNGHVKTETVDGPLEGNKDISMSTFDDKGNIIKLTNAYGRSIHYGHYNAFGQPGYQTDANGVYTEFKYDVKGRLISRTEYLETARVTRFKYNAFEQIIETMLPDGNRVQYTYDNAYRKIAEKDAQGVETRLTLDNSGNIVKSAETDVLTRVKEQTFDGLSQVRAISRNGEMKATYNYDATGNMLSETDALGNKTSYLYDALNRKVAIINSNGDVTRFRYNHQDKLTEVIDSNGNKTWYSYNDFGDLLTLTSPDSGTTKYDYDEVGNKISETLADGTVVNAQYDLINRIVAKQFTSPIGETSQHLYEYDNCDYGKGLLCKVVDSSGVTEYDYDASGNRYREIVTISGKQYTTQRRFDLMDRLIEVTYPSGNVVAYNRNKAGQVSKIRLNGQIVIDNITLDSGRISSWKYVNGMTVNRGFDLKDRLTHIVADNVLDLNFTYNANDHITQINNQLAGSSDTYAYDTRSRIIQESDISYGYDAMGNRLTQKSMAGNWLLKYANESNQLIKSNEQTVRYDSNGNIIQFGKKLYFYNQENRLTRFKQGDVTANYSYNFQGQRVSKQVSNQAVEQFIYSQGGEYLGHYQGNAYREYIFLDGLPAILMDGDFTQNKPTLSFVVTDHIGRPEVATDMKGHIVWQADNSAFNRRLTVTKIVLNLGFPGQYYDQEKDSWYNWHRDYDANLGRYLQSDPIGIKGGLNTYLYANANSLIYQDFNGLAPCSQKCTDAIKTANQDLSVLTRVASAAGVVKSAAASNNIPPSILFAIGMRESGFKNTNQTGGGMGRGVFQIDIGKNPHVTEAQANDIVFAANFAAKMLADNYRTLGNKFPNFTQQQLVQATAASYNFGTGNISGNPNTIDQGSSHNNYGTNVLGLMDCFN